MLNLDFSKNCDVLINDSYILPKELINHVSQQNKDTNSGPEYRLQKVYGNEIWNSIKRLGLENYDWNSKKILDVCCGSGFLSYHLTRHIDLSNLYGFDISLHEIEQAKKIIIKREKTNNNLLVSDAIDLGLKNSYFDVVIRNSFLHHFYNVSLAIEHIYDFLKPGGYFILLHEPTICAIPLEWGNLKLWLKCITKGKSSLDSLRYKGPNLVNNNSGADVWIFESPKLKNILINYGFIDIKIKPQRLFRSLTVGNLKLHLSKNKNKLSKIEEGILTSSIILDNICSRFLPDNFFGSLCIAARKRSELER